MFTLPILILDVTVSQTRDTSNINFVTIWEDKKRVNNYMEKKGSVGNSRVQEKIYFVNVNNCVNFPPVKLSN